MATLAETRPPVIDVPEHLVDEILAGRCVAFVGAGFSMPTMPSWAELLSDLVDESGNPGLKELAAQVLRDEKGAWKATIKPEHLEMLAQRIQDATTTDADFQAILADLVARRTHDPREETRKRIEHLEKIPFAAILTTNFDGLLAGRPLAREYWGQILRDNTPWTDDRHWRPGHLAPRPVLELHGRAADGGEPAVLTALGYRRRLFEDASYLQLVKTLFATRTVLFLGFSFTDEYIKLARNEVLSLLGTQRDAPIAYALMNDIDSDLVDYQREHLGLEIVSFDSNGGRDFSPFDRFLETLHDKTHPQRRLRALLRGKRILWVDPNEANNEYGYTYLESATGDASAAIVRAATWQHAMHELESGEFDLVITHWGHGGGGEGGLSVAERLLTELHRAARHVPVVVFATPDHADDNKRTALARGAYDYVFQWSTLFKCIDSLFDSGQRTG